MVHGCTPGAERQGSIRSEAGRCDAAQRPVMSAPADSDCARSALATMDGRARRSALAGRAKPWKAKGQALCSPRARASLDRGKERKKERAAKPRQKVS